MVLLQKPRKWRSEGTIYRKGVYLTLCAWLLETSQTSGIVKNIATIDALCGYVQPLLCAFAFSGCVDNSIYISAWASALLVQRYRAMRRPQAAGRVTDENSHAFSYIAVSNWYFYSDWEFTGLFVNQISKIKHNETMFIINAFTIIHYHCM